ncbi:unnamed protein product [Symbiodinium natans]|uniref:Uncharacterized protein n=1 Tax=Symbiodinium natans TaxID=878477 RepID=A0A812J6Z8_9DINO|nr:unnamed protein product [Symbiodinium natans]
MNMVLQFTVVVFERPNDVFVFAQLAIVSNSSVPRPQFSGFGSLRFILAGTAAFQELHTCRLGNDHEAIVSSALDDDRALAHRVGSKASRRVCGGHEVLPGLEQTPKEALCQSAF